MRLRSSLVLLFAAARAVPKMWAVAPGGANMFFTSTWYCSYIFGTTVLLSCCTAAYCSTPLLQDVRSVFYGVHHRDAVCRLRPTSGAIRRDSHAGTCTGGGSKRPKKRTCGVLSRILFAASICSSLKGRIPRCRGQGCAGLDRAKVPRGGRQVSPDKEHDDGGDTNVEKLLSVKR